MAILKQEGFEVISPRSEGMRGKHDLEHISFATSLGIPILSFNSHEFRVFHENLMADSKAHSGILVVHRYNNPKKDMGLRQIAKAIKNIIALKLPIPNHFYDLNEFKY
jgi:hypothetical protein